MLLHNFLSSPEGNIPFDGRGVSMSLVITYATNDYVVMSGDYRRVKVADENIYFDDSPKIFIVNEKVLCGMTGDIDVQKYLRANLKVNPKETVQSVAKKIKKAIKTIKHPDIYFGTHVTGISDTGKYEIITLSHRDNFKLNRTIVPKDGIRWIISFANEDPEEMIQKEFDSLEDYKSDSMIKLATKINAMIGEADMAVSPECDVLCLEDGNIKISEGSRQVIGAANVKLDS